jgi:hypothetical protein
LSTRPRGTGEGEKGRDRRQILGRAGVERIGRGLLVETKKPVPILYKGEKLEKNWRSISWSRDASFV